MRRPGASVTSETRRLSKASAPRRAKSLSSPPRRLTSAWASEMRPSSMRSAAARWRPIRSPGTSSTEEPSGIVSTAWTSMAPA